MERQHPRVSRETRLLLGIVVISLATLWVLARLRFPERPSSPDPVGPVLAQFAPPSPFDAIATAVSELERKVGPSLTRVTFTPRASDPTLRATVRVAIQVDAEHAAVVTPPGEGSFRSTPEIVAFTPRTGFALVRMAQSPPVASVSWTPQQVPSPRFVIAAEGTREGVSFRPVFVGAFTPVQGALWPGVVWRLPASSALPDGALLFTDDGLFIGAVVLRAGDRTMVPADTLRSLSHELSGRTPGARGVPGIAVQELTGLVADAVEVNQGLVVTWVDPKGPAAGLLQPLDVIDEVWGQPLTTREQWDARVDQLEVGGAFEIRMRRSGAEPRTLTLTAAAPERQVRPAPLGAVLRSRARIGVEILRVEPGGAADHAGLKAGDLITAVGPTSAPTPAQLTRAYADAGEDRPLAVAVTRGATHLVLAVEKAW